MMQRLLCALLLTVTTAPLHAQSWAQRMADATIARNPVVHERWDYTAGLILLAIDRVGDVTNDARYRTYVRRNLDAVVQADGSIRTYELNEFNLDQINEGRLLFDLYTRTRDERYRRAIERLREQLRQQPRTSEGGFWHKKIYPHQMWLDGIYMAAPFLAQYAKTFGDTTAFDEVTHQILLIARHTRDPKTGLYYHAWDEAKAQIWADRQTGHSPHFWGRALGWYAMAIVDVLDFLPQTHRDRAAIIATFRELAAAITSVQDPVTGLWYQILDQPSRAPNYHETSASSMFVYALAKGAHMNIIADSYLDVARRGHDGLTRYMTSTGGDTLLSLDRIVAVAGLGGNQQRDASFEYYMSEPVVSNDYKGVGAFILASLELGR
jgi:unsaturated rhamnogalacturonyl hydrolase